MTDNLCDKALALVDADIDQSLMRLDDLLRIPSISTDPAYADKCQAAADWLTDQLTGIGFDTKAHKTEGHPIVLGHDLAADGPHVLFYGHYDVQPVDPIALWHSDPFDPQHITRDGKDIIVARGASDDKGQVMTFVEACRAIRAAGGTLPLKISLLIEGEEEAGGENLPPFLTANAKELNADICLVCDTDMWDETTPSITTSLRGIAADEIVVTCADRDLHSGMYGNAARNPLQVVSDIVASLRNEDGSVAIEGFYDDVAELPEEIKKMWDGLDFDAEGFLSDVGLKIPAGEKDRSVMEQTTSRPTCEINGISGGYTGDGFKTVIPSIARAKISFRLVADQDPDKIRKAFRAHVEARIPDDCSVAFIDHGGAPAASVAIDNPFMGAARTALADEWGKEAILSGSGGSIPVVGDFRKILGLESLLIGFSQSDDNIHSPNEKYDRNSFHRGIRSWVRILCALAER